jgi:DNA-binding beta-propeller fold protein YncE
MEDLPFVYRLASSRKLSRVSSKLSCAIGRPTRQTTPLAKRPCRVVHVGAQPKQVRIAGSLALVLCMSGCVDVVDLETLTVSRRVAISGMPVDAYLDLHRGLCFVTVMVTGARQSGWIVVLDMERWTWYRTIELNGAWPKGITLRPETRELWVTNWLSSSISIVDIDSFDVVDGFRCGLAPRGLAFTPDGRVYVGGYYSRDICEINPSTRAVARRIPLPYRGLTYKGTPRDLLVSNGRLFVSNMGRSVVHCFDRLANGVLAHSTTVDVGCRPATLASVGSGSGSGSGDILCACHGSREVWHLQGPTLSPICKYPISGRPYGLGVTNDGRVVVPAFDRGTVESFAIGTSV